MDARTRTYLDSNASHPLLPEARDAVMAALDLANPSSVHAEGRKARFVASEARRNVAALANAKPEHVVFTSGATEAANLVLSPEWQMGRSDLSMSKLHVCASEHPAVLSGGRFAPSNVSVLPVSNSGELMLDALETALEAHDKTQGSALVSVQHANNETGVVQPLHAIAPIVKAHGGILVVDAVQTFGRIPLDVRSGCGDFFVVSSHKIGGPKGVGALIGVTDLLMPKPLIRGGGQEKGHRAGTEALPLIAGFGAAARSCADRVLRAPELLGMRQWLETIIRKCVPDAIIHGEKATQRLPNTLFFTIPGMKAETAQIAFDLAGVALSSGSACSSGKVGPSHVLKAMGIDSPEGAVRVSTCLETSQADLEAFHCALQTLASNRRP